MMWNEKVKEALDRTEFLALGTSGEDGNWTNPVAFAYDEKTNLFFISMMDAKHVRNILENPQTSAAIFSTERFSDGEVLGLQLTGNCKHLTEKEEIEEAARYYFGRSESNNEFLEETSVTHGTDALWQFFKITPAELWCFDSRLFGEKREQVDLELLDLTL